MQWTGPRTGRLSMRIQGSRPVLGPVCVFGHVPIARVSSRVLNDRSHLLTEQRLPESMQLDSMSIEQAVALMNQQDRRAVDAAGAVGDDIAAAVRIVVAQLKAGGRLFYFGAGTSGRLGVLDAAECPPT